MAPKNGGDIWRDGETSSSAPRTAHRRARKEGRSAHLDAELRTSRAFLNQRSLHARVLTLSSCRWRHGCCRSSLFPPHTLESLNKEREGGAENCCREKVRCACEHRPARSSARSLHHLVTGEREREEREGERGESAGGRGRGSPSIPDSSSSVLNSGARLTEGRKDRRHHHHPAVSLLLSRSAASSPAVKMHRHRPAQGLALFLPVALWICSHVRGAHGALPTTRKLLLLIFCCC